MPAMIMTISKDGVRGETVFLVRMYKHVSDIGEEAPVDVWECSAIYADEDTYEYLSDERTIERVMRREG
jgi:hypothetical protein